MCDNNTTVSLIVRLLNGFEVCHERMPTLKRFFPKKLSMPEVRRKLMRSGSVSMILPPLAPNIPQAGVQVHRYHRTILLLVGTFYKIQAISLLVHFHKLRFQLSSFDLDTALISNILNPKLKGASLDQKQKLSINFKVMKKLSGTNEYGEYVKFLKGSEKFSDTCLSEISSEMYWETFAASMPKLASLALIYLSFPASAFVNENNKPRILFDKSDKYKFVQEMLE